MILLQTNEDLRIYRNTIGIYSFKNKLNGKRYIGQSLTIGKRIHEHICALRNKSRQYSIHKALLKYGIENFEISILSIFDKRDNIREILNAAEQIYICFYSSFENGYNETAGGDSMCGRKWTSSQVEKMRKIMTGRKRPEDFINPRSKHIYAYDIVNDKYIDAPSAKHLIKLLNRRTTVNYIQACATGIHNSTANYICAYSKEELQNKIVAWKNRNKR